MHESPNWPDPAAHIRRQQPDCANLYFCPAVLQATAERFRKGFPGLVSYAVKANPAEEVLSNLVAAGIRTFDVASPQEMRAVRSVCPDAVLHYNNPVRSPHEVAFAVTYGVASYSVDCRKELDKLGTVPKGAEISVRLALPVKGAAYDFGEKFGIGPEPAAALLEEVAARGFVPSVTFHPGTQCADPAAWGAYIGMAARIARDTGVKVRRLNVGGGFAAHRKGAAPDLEAIFGHIGNETARQFGAHAPDLVCEPGRAMVAESFTLVTRVKALRDTGAVFLNDGVYGGLFETRDIGCGDRIQVISSGGVPRTGPAKECIVFGPTCDSLDRLPDPVALPDDLEEGDYVLFKAMGAYSSSLATEFNGYGLNDPVTVRRLS